LEPRNGTVRIDSEANMPAPLRRFADLEGQADMTNEQRFREAGGTASPVTIRQSQKIDPAQYAAHRLSLNASERIPP
jgi:hypothetical protein